MARHISADRRFVVVLICVVGWGLAVGGKLVKLQVREHDKLLERAEHQQQFNIDLSPMRGVIYDRSGHELARSALVKSLYAQPSKIVDPVAAADKLATVLDDIDRDALLKRLKSSAVMVVVKRKLTREETAAIEKADIPGLRLINEMKRFYVNGAAASHAIGFVDIDERGMGGVELVYDKVVRGQGGKILLDVDAFKNPYDHSVEDAVPGAGLTLTLDTMLQQDAEKALAEAIRTTGAKGGAIVILRPATGEILAIANSPTFDANKLADSSDEQRSNRAIETAFEPGSIFKAITYAAALDEGLIKPSSLIDCGRGEIKIGDHVIHDGHAGVMTARDALAKSSNVAAIKMGEKLGKARLAKYIEKFGFGRRTGIELPGESRGLLRDYKEWEATSLGAIPMGHEIGVTAVQAVAAFAAIANGGEWVQPHLVSQIGSSSDEPPTDHKAERRRVISESTANSLKEMLEAVVIHGTGKLAGISGYRAAGKTGTAQKVDPATGRYSKTRYVSSFAGFAPVENPQIACIVSIDEPRGVHLAAAVAAPVFAKVVADALRTLGVQPAVAASNEIASNGGHIFDISNTAGYPYLNSTSPAAAFDTAPAAAYQVSETRATELSAVPNLIGRGIREAADMCAARGIRLNVTGEGLVCLQSPDAGALIREGTVCYVTLSKRLLTGYRSMQAALESGGAQARGR